MTSLLTNVAAMTALQTLQNTNSMLESTQNRISTGYRVGEAKDNAAYWSIASSMRSENKAMSAITDALGIGSAVVDTSYAALSTGKDVLDEIKAKLVSASADGVDKAKIQSEISALQKQLKTVADSASFSGQNWLSNADTVMDKKILSSLSRDSSGKIAIGTIDVDTTSMRLFNETGATKGILDKDINVEQFSAGTGNANVETTAVTFAGDDKITFAISQNDGPGTTVEIKVQTLIDAGITEGATAGEYSIKSNSDLQAVYTQALKDAGISDVQVEVASADKAAQVGPPAVAAVTAGDVTFNSLGKVKIGAATSSGTTTPPPAADLGLSTTVDTDGTAAFSFTTNVVDIDISGLTSADSAEIQAYIKVVDQALTEVTTAASDLGAVQKRIELQQNFVDKLMDTIDKGVGTLVDADMTEESTKLKALQTQQQLGVQALSIANNSSQSVLSLFQG